MSELELSLLRARSLEALRQKARRGELFSTVAVGFVKAGRGKIEPDPDLRVREAIGLVFARFAEMQSIRQVFLSLRADRTALPYTDHRQAGERRPLWKLPVYATVNNLLTNPVYAGAYAFGRTGSRTTIEGGRKRVLRGHRKDRSEWAVLLVDHHEGYLSWAEYERNQRLIADNANGKGMMVRGPVRKGEALAIIRNAEFVTLQKQYLELRSRLKFANAELARQRTPLLHERVDRPQEVRGAQVGVGHGVAHGHRPVGDGGQDLELVGKHRRVDAERLVARPDERAGRPVGAGDGDDDVGVEADRAHSPAPRLRPRRAAWPLRAGS